MKTIFKDTFRRDLQVVRDKRLLGRIKEAIETIEAASSLNEVPNLRPLKGARNYFRIRIGDYRMGLVVESQTIVFVRFLHRREIYRYFP